MYVQATGELALFTTFYKSQKLFLRVGSGKGENVGRYGELNLTSFAGTLNSTENATVSSTGVSLTRVNSSEAVDSNKRASKAKLEKKKGFQQLFNHADPSTPVSLFSSVLASDKLNFVYECLTSRVRSYIMTWFQVLQIAADATSRQFGASPFLRMLELSRSTGGGDMELLQYERTKLIFQSEDSERLSQEAQHNIHGESRGFHVARSLAASPATVVTYQSKVGFELMLVDVSQVPFSLERLGLLPFGSDKLPSTFQRLHTDHAKLNGQPIESFHFHVARDVKDGDESIILPTCPFIGGFHSLPIAKTQKESAETSSANDITSEKDETDNDLKYVSNVIGSLESESCGRYFNISVLSIASEVCLPAIYYAL
jgi:hypothetical protein